MVETQVGFDYRSIMDPEPGGCRRTDGKKWICGKDVIPDQKYCERHMYRGRGRSRKLMEASEISLESVPVNLQLANPSPKSNSINSIGKAHAAFSIRSISGSEYRVYAKKESIAAATASPTINGIDKESNRNVYHSKDTMRPMTTTGLWTAGSDQINKCTSGSNSSIGKAPPTSATSSICGSGYKTYGKKDLSADATATPTTNNVDKDGGKNIQHSKDTTWSTTIGGPWRAGFESQCTIKSECVDGNDAAFKHLNNITIGQSKNYRHAGTAGYREASGLGFSPDSILQGCNSSCLKYRNDVEPELQRCRRTDGKKWRCGTDVVPNQKYHERHLHRGAKKPMVAEPVKVASAPLPVDICCVTPAAIPKKESGCINLNTNLSLSIAASSQQTANEEKRNTSSSDVDTIIDDNDNWYVQNDVPCGESISYNNRDYTLEFNTDQVFESRDAMLDWVRKIGLENGIVVVINKSSNLKGGKRPKCILRCERGGRYKPHRKHVDGQSKQRNTRTRKCDCPFELRGIPIPPNFVMWGLSVLCGFHNHEPEEYLDGHEYPSRLKSVEKEFVVDLADSKDTTRSTTTCGPWRAGFEKINECTSKSECGDGKDAAYKHLNNITIEQSKNYRHAGTAGSPVASRLGFSPDSVLQGCSSSCLKYRNVEPELQRCRRTDGKKWRCGTDVVPNQKYCERHLHRGAKKPLVAEPVKVALAPLPLDICRVTPLAIPKKGSGYVDLNTNLSSSIAAIPQQTANKEKGNTSSSIRDANTMSDYNDNWSVQNDVPCGERISYNNRDYTLEFNTDQVFESRDAMLDWVRKIGLENGIVVVISKSANLKGGKRPKCILRCERGGWYKPQRNSRTRKCECPFELRGIPIPPNFVMWGLSVLCGFHNHEPAEYQDGHEYP